MNREKVKKEYVEHLVMFGWKREDAEELVRVADLASRAGGRVGK